MLTATRFWLLLCANRADHGTGGVAAVAGATPLPGCARKSATLAHCLGVPFCRGSCRQGVRPCLKIGCLRQALVRDSGNHSAAATALCCSNRSLRALCDPCLSVWPPSFQPPSASRCARGSAAPTPVPQLSSILHFGPQPILEAASLMARCPASWWLVRATCEHARARAWRAHSIFLVLNVRLSVRFLI